MNQTVPVNPKRADSAHEIRVAVIFAALMLGIPFAVGVASRLGVANTADFKERILMALIAAFIVRTGNGIPKRLAAAACAGLPAARIQSFQRYAGWIWVLTGLGLGAAWLVLPVDVAGLVTLIVVPACMASVTVHWFWMTSGRDPAK